MAYFGGNLEDLINAGLLGWNNPLVLHQTRGRVSLPEYNNYNGVKVADSNLNINTSFESTIADMIGDSNIKVISDPNIQITGIHNSLFESPSNWTNSVRSIQNNIEAMSDPNIQLEQMKAKARAFDFESIGVKGEGSWMATELSIIGNDGTNKNIIYNALQEKEVADYVEGALRQAKTDSTQLTADQRRTLLSLTNYRVDKNTGNTVSIMRGYAPNTEINEKILNEVNEGIAALKQATYEGRQLTRADLAEIYRKEVYDYKGIKVAQNGYNFDEDLGARIIGEQPGKMKGLVDTLSLSQAFIDPASVPNYKQSSLAAFFGIEGNELTRHTSKGDTEELLSIYNAMVDRYGNQILTDYNSAGLNVGSVFMPSKYSWKTDKYDYTTINNKPINYSETDNLFDFAIFRANSPVQYNGYKNVNIDGTNKVALMFEDVITGEYSVIVRNSLDEASSFIESQLGPSVGTVDDLFGNIKGQDLIYREYASMFDKNTGYFNLKAQTDIYQTLISSGIDAKDIANMSEKEIGDILSKKGVSASKRQIGRFVTLRNIMSESGNNLFALRSEIDGAAEGYKGYFRQNLILSEVADSMRNTAKVPGIATSGIRIENTDLMLYPGSPNKKAISSYINKTIGKDYDKITAKDYRIAYNRLIDDMVSTNVIDSKYKKDLKKMITKHFSEQKSTGTIDLAIEKYLNFNNVGMSRLGYAPVGFSKDTISSTVNAAKNRIDDLLGTNSSTSIIENTIKQLTAINPEAVKSFTGEYKDKRFSRILKGYESGKYGVATGPNGAVVNSESVAGKLQSFVDTMKKNGVGVMVTPSENGEFLEINLIGQDKFDDFLKIGENGLQCVKKGFATFQMPLDTKGVLRVNGKAASNDGVAYISGKNIVFTTKAEQIGHRLNSISGIIASKIKEGDVEGAEAYIKKSVRDVVERTCSVAATLNPQKLSSTIANSDPNRLFTMLDRMDTTDFLDQALRAGNTGGKEITERQRILAKNYMQYYATGHKDAVRQSKAFNPLSQETKSFLEQFVDQFNDGILNIADINDSSMASNKIATRKIADILPFVGYNSVSQEKAMQGSNVIVNDLALKNFVFKQAGIDDTKKQRFLRDTVVAKGVIEGTIGVLPSEERIRGINVNYAAVSNSFLKGKGIASVYNDQVVVRPEVLKALDVWRDTKVKLDENFEFDEKFFEYIVKNNSGDGVMLGKEALEFLNVDENTGKIIIGGVRRGNKNYKQITANVNDIIKDFSRDEYGNIIFNKKEFLETKFGSKVLSQSGLFRGAIVASNEAFEGLSGDIDVLIGRGNISQKNIGSFLYDSTKYIMDNANEQQRIAIQKHITEGKYKKTIGVFGSFDSNGRFVFNNDNISDDIKTQLAIDIIALSKEQDVNMLLEKEVNGEVIRVGRTNMGRINDYAYQTPVGFSSKNFIEENSKFYFGIKEESAILNEIALYESTGERKLNYARGTILAIESSGKTGLNRANLSGEYRSVIDSIKNTNLLNKEGSDVSNINGLTLTVGGITNDFDSKRVELISDVYTPFSGLKNPETGKAGLSEIDYRNGTYNRIRELDRTADGFIIDFNESGIGPISLDYKDKRQGHKNIDRLYVPFVDPSRINGEYRPSEVEMGFNSIAENMKKFNEAKTQREKELARQGVSDAVRRYEDRLGKTYFNKNSELFHDMVGTRLSNAINTKSLGTNIADYMTDGGNGLFGHISTEQTIAMSASDIRGMLAIDEINLDKKGIKNATNKLKYEYAFLAGIDVNDEWFKGKNADDIIEGIIDQITISDDGKVNKSMLGSILRQPSLSNHDVQIANIVVDRNLTTGSASRASAGMAYLIKMDYDGDTHNISLAMMNRGYKNFETYKNVREDLAYISERQKRTSQLLGQLKASGELADEGKYVSVYDSEAKIRDILSKKFGANEVDSLVGVAAKEGKNKVGLISNYGRGIKNLAEDVKMIGAGASDEILKSGLILEGFTSSLEQELISSKHLIDQAQKMISSDTGEASLIDFLQTGADDMFTAIKNGDFDSAEQLGLDLGLFEKIDGKTVMKTDHMKFALAHIEANGLGDGALTQKGYVTYDEIKEAYQLLDSRVKQKYGDTKTINDVLSSVDFSFGTKNYEGISADLIDDIVDLDSGRASASKSAQKIFGGTIRSNWNKERAATQFADHMETIGEGLNVNKTIDSAKKTLARDVETSSKAFMTSLKEKGKAFAPLAIGIGALWATTAVLRGPRIDQTPAAQEEEEVYDPNIANSLAMAAPSGAGPTARLTPNTSPMTIKIKGNSSNGLTNEELLGIIEREMYRQANTKINIQMQSSDDRQSMDSRWFENKVSKML